MKESGIPSLGKTSIDVALEDSGVASCLTATRRDFSNVPHCDADDSPFTYGIWLTTKTDGTLVEGEVDCWKAVDGGEFFWADYGVGARFRECPGMIELMWRGKDDWHGTARSQTKEGYQRWGTSVQVSAKLKRYMQVHSDIRSLQPNDLATRMRSWAFRHRRIKEAEAEKKETRAAIRQARKPAKIKSRKESKIQPSDEDPDASGSSGEEEIE